MTTAQELKAAAPLCKGGELYQDATQVVFGRGDIYITNAVE